MKKKNPSKTLPERADRASVSFRKVCGGIYHRRFLTKVSSGQNMDAETKKSVEKCIGWGGGQITYFP